MGWGTEFKADIYLSRMSFENKYILEDKIKETEEYINNLKTKLSLYAVSSPKDIVDPEWTDDVITWVKNQMDEILEELIVETIVLYKLNLFKETVEEDNNNFDKFNPNKNGF